MALIVAGRLNKQVSYALGISEVRAKAQRAKTMRKMRAVCFADLVRIASRLCPTPVLRSWAICFK
jgi:FixJ family two-component response regulator